MEIIEGKYKNNDVIIFKEGDRIRLAIGFYKLRLIVEHIEQVKKIIDHYYGDNG